MDHQIIECLASSNSPDHSAAFAFLGALVGSLFSILGVVVHHCLRERSIAKRDAPRKKVLRDMLEAENPAYPERWRKLDTLMHVTGANQETTKRLLLEIGARASEDGKDLWGLVKHHPLNQITTP